MLEINSIKVNYDKSKVINDLSFHISQGDKLTILGRNGVGKTTLLKSIMGVLPLVEGSITFTNGNITDMPPHMRSQMGMAYVPQGRGVIPEFTVDENLILGAYAHTKNIGEIKEVVFKYFPVLKDHLQRKAGVLSGGQQQQLAIGRALMSSPKLLLLDEPTDGIQPNVVSELANILNQIRKDLNVTIVVVEQNLKFALKVADKYIIMQKGDIVADGLVNELTDEIVNKYLAI